MATLILGDCFEGLKSLSEPIDLVFTDPPYAMTDCEWDTPFDLGTMWAVLKARCKSKAAMAFTASQPFTSRLIMSNLNDYKVEWIWHKNAGSNIGTTRWYPMKEHESIVVFGNGKGPVATYNAIRQPRAKPLKTGWRNPSSASKGGAYSGIAKSDKGFEVKDGDMRVPSSVQFFIRERGLHPNQKPVALCDYFIRTYSNEGELVVDPFAGSASTGVAAIKSGRRFIGFETNPEYFEKAVSRLQSLYEEPALAA